MIGMTAAHDKTDRLARGPPSLPYKIAIPCQIGFSLLSWAAVIAIYVLIRSLV